ncbi:MAG: M23 family metallopeptidase [Patescibacteria group bacterium]
MNQRGFTPIAVIVTVIILLATSGGAFLMYQKSATRSSEKNQNPSTVIIGLGSLCSGEKECNYFCKNNFGRCKEYCQGQPDNVLCQKSFSFERPIRGEEKYTSTLDKTITAKTPLLSTAPLAIVVNEQKQLPLPEKPKQLFIPEKSRVAELKAWMPDVMTQPIPVGASKTRLTSFPAPLDKIFITGPYGAHRGGHVEGLDHEWIEIADDTPIVSWARGKVTNVFLNNPNKPEDWRIYVDYGDGLSGEHMDVKTPLVKTGDEVEAGQSIAYGLPVQWLNGYHSGEFNLVDQYRKDGVQYRDGVTVSPYDYLREDLKTELIAAYTKQFIEPFVQRNEFFMGFAPWEPYLTNPLIFHKQYKGTIIGEWYLKSKKWAVDEAPDMLIFLRGITKYYDKQRLVAGEDASAAGATFDGTWVADYEAKKMQIVTERGIYYGIFELNESEPRATLKIQYQTGSYPTVFSDQANIYIERSVVQRRQDGYDLGVLNSL